MDFLEIQKRLEKAEGPDREIDALIMVALAPGTWRMPSGDLDLHFPQSFPAGAYVNIEHGTTRVAPELTASVDEVLKLIERALPVSDHWAPGSLPSSGWKIGMYRGMTPTDGKHHVWEVMIRPHGSSAGYDTTAKTPAIALLIALCKAMCLSLAGEMEK